MARASTAADRLRLFLEWGNVCDAPWANRSLIAGMLRQIPMAADLLPPAARTFYEALPDPLPIWRGCIGAASAACIGRLGERSPKVSQPESAASTLTRHSPQPKSLSDMSLRSLSAATKTKWSLIRDDCGSSRVNRFLRVNERPPKVR